MIDFMRIQLTLRAANSPTNIPLNYNLSVSGFIYQALNNARPEYMAWLQERGFLTPENLPLKLFTFSRLDTPEGTIDGDEITMPRDSPVYLYMSSPMIDETMLPIVLGSFKTRNIVFAGKHCHGRFHLESAKRYDLPPWESPEKFDALSPVTITTLVEREGKREEQFLHPEDAALPEALRINLVQKFYAIHGHAPVNDRLTISVDREYVVKRGGWDSISNVIYVKEGVEKGINIRAFLCRLRLEGSTELIETALEAGMGERNSLGFGMMAPHQSHSNLIHTPRTAAKVALAKTPAVKTPAPDTDDEGEINYNRIEFAAPRVKKK